MPKGCPEIQRRGGDRYREVKRCAKESGVDPSAEGLLAQQSGRDHLEAPHGGAPEDNRRGHKIGYACRYSSRNGDQHVSS